MSLTDPFTDSIRPRWHPRVKQHLVRRLYENEAQGILDEELINAVGTGLLLRCQSILKATAAHEGRATCPRCDSLIPHQWHKDEVMTCAQCGWQTTWGAYFKRHEHGGLRQRRGGQAIRCTSRVQTVRLRHTS